MPFIALVRFFCFMVFALLPALLFGQYYNEGQDPASLNWRQITTPHFRIIYPENFELKAREMIPSLDFVHKHGNKTLAYSPKQLPVIIHNYNTISNGFTAWAPKRIELYTCPPQDSYAQKWMDQLMVHEYRHVVQIDRMNQGFTKGLSWLSGEQAASMIIGLFVPSWFMEGDAVCTETALSQSGRGRIPSFEMLLRAQVTQEGAYTYDKAAFGSYKNFVPNQYVLGYSLVANVRRKYGYQSWITTLDEVARKPFLITPFNNGLKKATGSGKEELYSITMHEMDSMWKLQDTQTPKTAYDLLTVVNKKKYENYKYPRYLDDSLVVSELTSLDDITRFVLTGPGGYRKILATPGFLSSDIFTITETGKTNNAASTGRADNGKNYLLAWTETIDDYRWEQRNYSVIRIFDSGTSKTRTLTSKSRYFAPAFSPDGSVLAAVCVDPTNKSSVVLIDAKNGMETETLIVSDSDFYMTPSWSGDGTKIVFTKLDDKGKSIVVIDLKSRAVKTLLPSTFVEIANPVFANDYILFNGSFSGIENIYALDTKSGGIMQVTSAGFGAANADLSPDGQRIVYSNYSSGGYSLAETAFNPNSWKRLDEISDYSPSLYKHLVEEESSFAGSTEADADSTQYPSKPYKKAEHIFNFHSWAPAYINYMTGENGTGISFMSQNELSTVTTVVGYLYDITENTGKVTANVSWEAWYPVIDFNTSYGTSTVYTTGDTSYRYNFNETSISGGFTLPLLFTGGKYYKGLRLRAHTTWNDVTKNTSPAENKYTGTMNSLDYSITAYRYIKQSGKDMYPRWGQYVTGSFRHTPFGKNDLGSIVYGGVRLYFPGLMQHHSVRVDAYHQVKYPGKYTYSNQIALPRGYVSVNTQTLTSYAFNYKFPLAYPDISLGPLVYLKRLKANMFYDGGLGSTHGQDTKLQSTGIEITSDLHIFRFIFPLDIGFRIGYRPIEKQYFSDFLFSVNLSD